MSMTAQYPPHPLSRKLPRKQTPRKTQWATSAAPFDPSKVRSLTGRDSTATRVTRESASV